MKHKLITLFLVLICITLAFSMTAEKGGKLDAFREYILEMKENWKVPGMAVGIVESDEVIFMETFGTLSYKGITDVNEHTTFQIGSTTKAFTATLMAMLEEKGALSWNDGVREHYPTFQMADPWVSENMRIHDLMAQHSGMHPYVGDMAVMFGFDADYILDKLKYMEPLYQFRKDFTYVNTLFLVSEKILESKFQSAFEAIMCEKIFKPLSMNDSSISYEDHLQKKNKTTTHVYSIENKSGEVSFDLKPLNPFEPQFEWSYIYAPAGGIDSSISDMVKWLRFNMNYGEFNGQRLVSEESMVYLHTPNTIVSSNNKGDINAYCQGWVYETFLSYPMMWHNGSTIGSKTMIAFIPELDIGMVILTNVGGIALADNLVKDFFEMIITGEMGSRAKTEFEKSIEDIQNQTTYQPEQFSDPLELSAYTGTYYNDVYGLVQIEQINGMLQMKLGPLDDPFQFKHLNRDSFEVFYNKCGITSIGVAIFKIDAFNSASSFSIDEFAAEGTGDFKRIESNE